MPRAHRSEQEGASIMAGAARRTEILIDLGGKTHVLTEREAFYLARDILSLFINDYDDDSTDQQLQAALIAFREDHFATGQEIDDAPR
jgi:hypothetical protein